MQNHHITPQSMTSQENPQPQTDSAPLGANMELLISEYSTSSSLQIFRDRHLSQQRIVDVLMNVETRCRPSHVEADGARIRARAKAPVIATLAAIKRIGAGHSRGVHEEQVCGPTELGNLDDDNQATIEGQKQEHRRCE